MGFSSDLSLPACSSLHTGCWHMPAHEGRSSGCQVGTGLGQRGARTQQQGPASTPASISSPGCRDMEEHLAGAVQPRYHLCPLAGPNACWPGQDAGGAQQALLWSPSLPLTTAIDSHLLLIGVDSSSGVRKEEAHFPRPRCPMRGHKPSGIPLSSQRGSRHGHCWEPLVQLLPWRVDGHGKTRLRRAGGCLGTPRVAEMGTALRAPSSITGDASLQHF